MAGTGPLDLQALAQEFLDACIDALDTIPLFDSGLGGAPSRSFVSPGQPQYDCCPDGQLTVHVPLVSSDPVLTIRNHERRNIVTLSATILRCVPAADDDGGWAPAAEVQAAAEQVNADGWALWNFIFNAISSGDLFTLCDKIQWLGMRSIVPSGGCGGWILTLSVQTDGYTP